MRGDLGGLLFNHTGKGVLVVLRAMHRSCGSEWGVFSQIQIAFHEPTTGKRDANESARGAHMTGSSTAGSYIAMAW